MQSFMTNDQLLLYSFAKGYTPLVKLLQSNALLMVDKSDKTLTYMIYSKYFTNDEKYLSFLRDMDETKLVYQCSKVTNNYYLRIYL